MDSKTDAFDPAAHGWEHFKRDGFITVVGPIWARPTTSPEEAPQLAFLAAPKHHNRRNVVQGGMLMTFADLSMGVAAWHANGKQPQATVQLDVHFVDAVDIGEFVEAHCKVTRRTRSLVFVSAELMVGDRVVCTANGVWKILGQ
jgi:acyl-coenzyme A thioesterase PaaI-like protein